MPTIFISYRRDDSADYCDRITDYLERRFGRRAVFRDINTILAGSNFVTALRTALIETRVMLVLIGPRWLNATDANGQRRLDIPDDFVRYEIATALHTGKQVVPVLIGGASMPTMADLPPDLAGLAHCPPCIVHPDMAFANDMATLIHDIRSRAARRIASISVLLGCSATVIAALCLFLIEFRILPSQGLAALYACIVIDLVIAPPIMAVFAVARSLRAQRRGWAITIGAVSGVGILSEIAVLILALGLHSRSSALMFELSLFFSLPAAIIILIVFAIAGPEGAYGPPRGYRLAYIPVFVLACVDLACVIGIVIVSASGSQQRQVFPFVFVASLVAMSLGGVLAITRAWQAQQWLWVVAFILDLVAMLAGLGIYYVLQSKAYSTPLFGSIFIAPLLLGAFGWRGPHLKPAPQAMAKRK